jgi:hypothetical protein
MASALVAGLALSGSAVAANEDNSGGSGNAEAASEGNAEGNPGETVSDEELEKFAQAYGQIRSVRAQYQQKIQQAEGKEQKSKLKKEGRQEMMGAIQEAGLDVSEYQRIGKQLNQSQELQKRLQQKLGGSGDSSGDSSN